MDSLLQLEKVNATLREYVDVDQTFSIYMFQLMTLRHQLNLVNLEDQRRMVDLIRLLRVINRTNDYQSFLSERDPFQVLSGQGLATLLFGFTTLLSTSNRSTFPHLLCIGNKAGLSVNLYLYSIAQF